MRCYFMRDGNIESVKELPGLADHEVIAKAHALFSERRRSFEGFELWDRSRVLIRHPEAAAATVLASGGFKRSQDALSPRFVPRLAYAPPSKG